MNRVKQPDGSIKYVTHVGSEFGSLAEALEWEACLDWAWVDELEEQTKLKGGSKSKRNQGATMTKTGLRCDQLRGDYQEEKKEYKSK